MTSLPLKRATVAGCHGSETLDSTAERLTEFMALHSFCVKWEMTPNVGAQPRPKAVGWSNGLERMVVGLSLAACSEWQANYQSNCERNNR